MQLQLIETNQLLFVFVHCHQFNAEDLALLYGLTTAHRFDNRYDKLLVREISDLSSGVYPFLLKCLVSLFIDHVCHYQIDA